MAIGAMVSTVMLISEPALILLCILLTTLAFAFAAYHDHRSRRFVLAYDLDAAASKRYDVLVDAYRQLQQAGSVRGIDEETGTVTGNVMPGPRHRSANIVCPATDAVCRGSSPIWRRYRSARNRGRSFPT